MKVLIGPSSFGDHDTAPVNELREAGFEVAQNGFGRKLTAAELADLLPGVAGLIAGLEPLTRETLQRSELRVISRCGVGLSNVDLDAARDLGIRVCSTPDAPTTAVAEVTVGALIALLRGVSQMDRDLHQGRWRRQMGEQIEGKTIAIVGFGRIGRKVAALLGPFGASLVAVDPALGGSVAGVPIVGLEEALTRADVISLHAGGESQILGDQHFARMKPGVWILNASRGALLDEPSLCRALDAGVVAGAWLDAFRDEPYAGPLIAHSNVVLTPHIGSATVACRRRMDLEAVENLLAAFAEMAPTTTRAGHV